MRIHPSANKTFVVTPAGSPLGSPINTTCATPVPITGLREYSEKMPGQVAFIPIFRFPDNPKQCHANLMKIGRFAHDAKAICVVVAVDDKSQFCELGRLLEFLQQPRDAASCEIPVLVVNPATGKVLAQGTKVMISHVSKRVHEIDPAPATLANTDALKTGAGSGSRSGPRPSTSGLWNSSMSAAAAAAAGLKKMGQSVGQSVGLLEATPKLSESLRAAFAGTKGIIESAEAVVAALDEFRTHPDNFELDDAAICAWARSTATLQSFSLFVAVSRKIGTDAQRDVLNFLINKFVVCEPSSTNNHWTCGYPSLHEWHTAPIFRDHVKSDFLDVLCEYVTVHHAVRIDKRISAYVLWRTVTTQTTESIPNQERTRFQTLFQSMLKNAPTFTVTDIVGTLDMGGGNIDCICSDSELELIAEHFSSSGAVLDPDDFGQLFAFVDKKLQQLNLQSTRHFRLNSIQQQLIDRMIRNCHTAIALDALFHAHAQWFGEGATCVVLHTVGAYVLESFREIPLEHWLDTKAYRRLNSPSVPEVCQWLRQDGVRVHDLGKLFKALKHVDQGGTTLVEDAFSQYYQNPRNEVASSFSNHNDVSVGFELLFDKIRNTTCELVAISVIKHLVSGNVRVRTMPPAQIAAWLESRIYHQILEPRPRQFLEAIKDNAIHDTMGDVSLTEWAKLFHALKKTWQANALVDVESSDVEDRFRFLLLQYLCAQRFSTIESLRAAFTSLRRHFNDAVAISAAKASCAKQYAIRLLNTPRELTSWLEDPHEFYNLVEEPRPPHELKDLLVDLNFEGAGVEDYLRMKKVLGAVIPPGGQNTQLDRALVKLLSKHFRAPSTQRQLPLDAQHLQSLFKELATGFGDAAATEILGSFSSERVIGSEHVIGFSFVEIAKWLECPAYKQVRQPTVDTICERCAMIWFK